MLKEFKEFAMKGNVVDMAIGVIIGAAFGAIVSTLVSDVLMPIIGLLSGGMDFSNMYVLLKDGAKAPGPYASLAAAKDAGAVTIAYGLLINTVVNFLIVAMSLFVVVKGMNAAQRTPPPAPAEAPAPSAEEVLLTQIRDLLARR
ncbi:MAG: large conductance mechanosensitive channel protein MscL [Vicinamibacterales bacterium]